MKKTIFALIAACMAFVSCDLLENIIEGMDKDTIVGTWEMTLVEMEEDNKVVTITPEEATMTLEFKEDGNYVQTNVIFDEDGNVINRNTINGTYKTEGSKLTLNLDDVYDFTIDSDKLIIKNYYKTITLVRK
jgi:uncharacterized protein (TIGR03066 family)